jgi:hypothetical protein
LKKDASRGEENPAEENPNGKSPTEESPTKESSTEESSTKESLSKESSTKRVIEEVEETKQAGDAELVDTAARGVLGQVYSARFAAVLLADGRRALLLRRRQLWAAGRRDAGRWRPAGWEAVRGRAISCSARTNKETNFDIIPVDPH